jgi:hypothetical protein
MSKVTHSILAISVRALTYPPARPLHLPCSCLAHCSTPGSVRVLLCEQHLHDELTYMLHSAELGIDADFNSVNLVEGENFKPEFVKLVSCSCLRIHQTVIEAPSSQNPNATLPTLTHDGKTFTSATEVINYLVSVSSTKVAPETSITTVVHEDKIDPNFALFAAVRPRSSSSICFPYSIGFSGTKRNSPKSRAALQTPSPEPVSIDGYLVQAISLSWPAGIFIDFSSLSRRS